MGKKWCEKSGKKIKTVEKNTVEKKLGEKSHQKVKKKMWEKSGVKKVEKK